MTTNPLFDWNQYLMHIQNEANAFDDIGLLVHEKTNLTAVQVYIYIYIMSVLTSVETFTFREHSS